MKFIAVFCGSKSGDEDKYSNIATELGKIMANRNIGLVYGGGKVGLMGDVSSSIIKNNGHAIGVIPNFMVEKELANREVQELIEVDSMHERKKVMSEKADAFIILPGGIGTMDEFFEIYTWKQLGLHNKPIVIIDQEMYYAPLFELLNQMKNSNFLHDEHLENVHFVDYAEDALDYLENSWK